MNGRRTYARDILGFGDDRPRRRTPEQDAIVAACRASFRAFLQYWQFKNRETGEVLSFATLWPGQERLAAIFEQESWVFALKAGKLGFTELECAYDAWVALFRQPNARVHIFSRDAAASRTLLDYVRFGIEHLPPWLRLPILREEPGGDTMTSLKLGAGIDDVRTIVSYPAGPNVSIDQSATHVHVDELSHMASPERTWGAIETTVAPGGSCHIVTRGAGEDVFTARLWEMARSGVSQLYPFFAPWSDRPDRDRAWREAQAGNLAGHALLFFAPETPEDALAGEDMATYIPMEIWDHCHDPALPQLQPGDRTPIVLGVDASVTGDCFAIVAVSRHPGRPDEPAIRAYRVWRPQDSPSGRIDFDAVERHLRILCGGGCPLGHPQSMPLPGCRDCGAGNFVVPGYKVVQIAYDPYQLESMMQRLRRDGVAWCREFQQAEERLKADAGMLQLALRGRLAHNGGSELREHIANCRAKVAREADTRLRIVKAAPNRRVDLAVAASMAVARVM